MLPELEQQIRRVFPKGNDDEIDESQFVQDMQERLERAMDCIGEILPLQVSDSMGFPSQSIRIGFVAVDAQEYLEQCRPGTQEELRAAKIRWITERGEPYVVLLITVSRVANYFGSSDISMGR